MSLSHGIQVRADKRRDAENAKMRRDFHYPPSMLERVLQNFVFTQRFSATSASLRLSGVLLILLVLSITPVQAHDPYEISSVVYLQTNRIELLVEMEFPTGMRLAGLTPTKDVAVLSQFDAGQTRLFEAAGSFYEITAANNVIQPLSTNVELGVEDHIRFHVEFANTPHRPLHFAARSLKALAEQGGYGASLTVLDMVNKKVLGQTTIFADSPAMEFSVTNQIQHSATIAAVDPTITAAINSPAKIMSVLDTSASLPPSSSRLWLWLAVAAGIALIIGFVRPHLRK